MFMSLIFLGVVVVCCCCFLFCFFVCFSYDTTIIIAQHLKEKSQYNAHQIS